MSEVGVLGIVASAAQLVAYSVKIFRHLSDVYTETRKAAKRKREYLSQVQDLIGTATLIEGNKFLQTPLILSQLQATLEEARSLYNKISRLASTCTGNTIWKYWTVLKGSSEQEILNGLSNLEREKSALTLRLSVVNSELLFTIHGSIHTFLSIGKTTPPHEALMDSKTRTENLKSKSQGHDHDGTPSFYRRLGGEMLRMPPNQADPVSQGNSPANPKGGQRDAKSAQPDSEPGTHRHAYTSISTVTSVALVAGDVYSDEALNKDFYEIAKESKGNSYHDVTAGNATFKVAGHVYGTAMGQVIFGAKKE